MLDGKQTLNSYDENFLHFRETQEKPNRLMWDKSKFIKWIVGSKPNGIITQPHRMGKRMILHMSAIFFSPIDEAENAQSKQSKSFNHKLFYGGKLVTHQQKNNSEYTNGKCRFRNEYQFHKRGKHPVVLLNLRKTILAFSNITKRIDSKIPK